MKKFFRIIIPDNATYLFSLLSFWELNKYKIFLPWCHPFSLWYSGQITGEVGDDKQKDSEDLEAAGHEGHLGQEEDTLDAPAGRDGRQAVEHVDVVVFLPKVVVHNHLQVLGHEHEVDAAEPELCYRQESLDCVPWCKENDF